MPLFRFVKTLFNKLLYSDFRYVAKNFLLLKKFGSNLVARYLVGWGRGGVGKEQKNSFQN